jgi:hypothetical protein
MINVCFHRDNVFALVCRGFLLVGFTTFERRLNDWEQSDPVFHSGRDLFCTGRKDSLLMHAGKRFS